MRRIQKFFPVLALTLCQCVPTAPSRVAQSRGAQELECPIEQVSAYRAGEGLYVAHGCGHWTEYDCISSGRGTFFASTMCSARGSVVVHDDPERL
jgi:hypothetical protein